MCLAVGLVLLFLLAVFAKRYCVGGDPAYTTGGTSSPQPRSILGRSCLDAPRARAAGSLCVWRGNHCLPGSCALQKLEFDSSRVSPRDYVDMWCASRDKPWCRAVPDGWLFVVGVFGCGGCCSRGGAGADPTAKQPLMTVDQWNSGGIF